MKLAKKRREPSPANIEESYTKQRRSSTNKSSSDVCATQTSAKNKEISRLKIANEALMQEVQSLISPSVDPPTFDNEILRLKDVLSFTSDSWFGQIAHNLRYDMICGYRNVLSVYSRAWPSIDQVNEIRFSRRKYASPPSMTHDVHAMIVVRLIRDWMSKVHRVLVNVESKYYSVTTTVST